MFKTLYARLAAVLLGVFVLAGLLYVALSLYATRAYVQEVNQKLNRSLAEDLVAERGLIHRGVADKAALAELFERYMVINPSIELYLLGPGGDILAYSAPPGKVKRDRVSLRPVRRFLEGPEAFPIFGDDPRDTMRKKVFSVAPVVHDGRTEGYLYVVLGGEGFDAVAAILGRSYVARLSGWALGGSLLFALLTGLLLFNFMTRRLSRLAKSMQAFESSDFQRLDDAVGEVRGDDEIGRLTTAFVGMARRIVEQLQRLRQTDSLRRELVANVSHDLRTPLASLQGYLETLILKDDSLSVAEKRDYLQTAIKHSERLGKLVAELFELACLDAGDIRLDREPFPLADLAQDVWLKFGLRMEQRAIIGVSEIPSDLPRVNGDIGLIERVLENLIENALRYTPAGGRIIISLRAAGDTVELAVSDTGCGIAPADLDHIFERFYRAQAAGSGGAGLGLAIAQRIVTLHGGRIHVASRPGEGSRFWFALPCHAEDLSGRDKNVTTA